MRSIQLSFDATPDEWRRQIEALERFVARGHYHERAPEWYVQYPPRTQPLRPDLAEVPDAALARWLVWMYGP